MSTLSVSKYRAHDHAPLHSPTRPAALAKASRLPVGPFLLGTCLPTLRVHIARSYTAAYYEDVCRHSRRLVLAADGTADVWRKQHAVASAEPRTTVGVAPSLIAPTLFLDPLEKVLNNASLRSARTWSNFTSSALQSRLHSHAPSNIRTLSNGRNLGALTHSLACPRAPSLAPTVPPPPLLGVPGPFCVCSQRHYEIIKSAPTEHSSAPSAFAHPSCKAQARSRARMESH